MTAAPTFDDALDAVWPVAPSIEPGRDELPSLDDQAAEAVAGLIDAARRGDRLDQLDQLSQYPHVLHAVDFDQPGYVASDCTPVDNLDDAVGFSSEIADGPHAGFHTLALDLDVPARLVPSSTPGHSHLYVDAVMPLDVLVRLLKALADAGVIEPGYAAASERRGHTTLRLPWIKKGDTE